MSLPFYVGRKLFVVTLTFLLLHISQVMTQCTVTWTDEVDVAGQQDQRDVAHFVASLDECKQKCVDDTNCIIITFNSGVCNLYYSTPTKFSQTGATYSTKSCQTGCSMASQAGVTASSDNQISIDLSDGLTSGCETLCKSVPQTKCTAYSVTSSTCSLHDTTASTSSRAGSEYGARSTCDDGRVCCFDSVPNAIGDSTVTSLATTLSSCETLCLAFSNCVALTYTTGSCTLMSSLPSGTSSDSQSTYSVKSCPSGATDGTLTLTTTCKADAAKLSVSLLCVWTMYWTQTFTA